jgi:hypothetical protein
MAVRYLDRYAQDLDGRWLFAKRVVTYDYRGRRPITQDAAGAVAPGEDASYAALTTRLFARGARL